MNITKKHVVRAVGVISLFLVVGSLVAINRPSAGATQTVYIHALYAADFEDPATLVGASHNIFVGKVLGKTGDKEIAKSPAGQYAVSVIRNVKGDLSGTVTVEQEGGYRDGKLYLMEGTTLLEDGATYLFATRYNKKDDAHTINSYPMATKLLSRDGTADTDSLGTIADADPRVKELTAAYPIEAEFNPDVVHENARNSFKDLPEEAKVGAVRRAEAAGR
jgi:hypothetical protein